MSAVSEDQCREAIALIRWEARNVRSLPAGVTLDDLESVGNEAIARAAAEYDPACGVEFKTHARHVARGMMNNFVQAARRRKHKEREFAADPETGVQWLAADPRATGPDRMAEVGELLPAVVPGKKPQKYITVSRVDATTPEAAEVGRRVAEYQTALHAALTPADVGDVVKMVVGKAKGGSLTAAKMVIDMATPAKAGVTVQQAVVVQPRDLE